MIPVLSQDAFYDNVYRSILIQTSCHQCLYLSPVDTAYRRLVSYLCGSIRYRDYGYRGGNRFAAVDQFDTVDMSSRVRSIPEGLASHLGSGSIAQYYPAFRQSPGSGPVQMNFLKYLDDIVAFFISPA